MKAVVIKNYGGPEVLQLMEVPTPSITDPSQVLVKVKASSVNPLDYQVRRGDYASFFDLPIITGHDISGQIVAVGIMLHSLIYLLSLGMIFQARL